MTAPKLDELTPDQRHLRESQGLKAELLNRFGMQPRVLAPTRDGQGNVRLTFAELRTLLDGEKPDAS